MTYSQASSFLSPSSPPSSPAGGASTGSSSWAVTSSRTPERRITARSQVLQQRPWEENYLLLEFSNDRLIYVSQTGNGRRLARISFQKVRCLEFLLNYRTESVVLLSLWAQWEPDRWREWLTVSENDYQHSSIFSAPFLLRTFYLELSISDMQKTSRWSLIFRIMALSSSSSTFPNVSFDYITCWATVQSD